MTDYGYVDVGKLADFANNTIGGLTANDIMRFPRADVQPAKRGHWELIDGQEKWIQGYTCSECGQVVVTYECNFCPNCGADMRGQLE